MAQHPLDEDWWGLPPGCQQPPKRPFLLAVPVPAMQPARHAAYQAQHVSLCILCQPCNPSTLCCPYCRRYEGITQKLNWTGSLRHGAPSPRAGTRQR
jgi:hypothetical protein